jgi:hypothetical protein
VLLRNYLAGCGIPAIICAPDELEYGGGVLRRGDFRIDLVYKRVIYNEFLSRYDETHPLLRAYANRDICLINPIRCKLMHKKASFAMLTDEAYDSWFSGEERSVIHDSIPWTRMARDSRTLYRGANVDLIEHVGRNREDFIIKPNDDYGGRGITLGKSASQPEWEAAIEDALRGDYVVQEALDLETEEFPIFGDHEWSLQPMFVDTNPFIFRGDVEGAMVRLSDSPIVNVTSGGGETGFFVLEEE